MTTQGRTRLLRTAIIAAVLAAGSAQPAAAFDLFGRLFGWHRHSAPPPDVSSFVDPRESFARAVNPAPLAHSDTSTGAAICVRTCDGFHFAVHGSGATTAAQMCHAFCPGSETRLFFGRDIDFATAGDGSRYTDLDTAYGYRKQVVAGCTCNGRTPFGLSHINAADDPTLRPGDVVATKDGLMAYTGAKDKTADFTPAANYPQFSASYRESLAQMRIAPPSLKPAGEITSLPPAGESRSAAK
jgi:hypothetical protein